MFLEHYFINSPQKYRWLSNIEKRGQNRSVFNDSRHLEKNVKKIPTHTKMKLSSNSFFNFFLRPVFSKIWPSLHLNLRMPNVRIFLFRTILGTFPPNWHPVHGWWQCHMARINGLMRIFDVFNQLSASAGNNKHLPACFHLESGRPVTFEISKSPQIWILCYSLAHFRGPVFQDSLKPKTARTSISQVEKYSGIWV